MFNWRWLCAIPFLWRMLPSESRFQSALGCCPLGGAGPSWVLWDPGSPANIPASASPTSLSMSVHVRMAEHLPASVNLPPQGYLIQPSSAGSCDGLLCGDNLAYQSSYGLVEIVAFADLLQGPGVHSTFLESCG